jgi:hypothetical protein
LGSRLASQACDLGAGKPSSMLTKRVISPASH